MIRRMLATLVPVALLVACSTPAGSGQESQGGGESSAASAAGASAPATAAASIGGGGGGGLASFDVTITGGAKAGHYTGDITVGGCSSGVMGAGTFSVASTTVDPANDFDGPQIVVYDAEAAASGTDNFSAAFTFNKFATTVEVNHPIDRGTGTLTLDNKGSTATVTIEGTSSDGDAVAATIECHSVANF